MDFFTLEKTKNQVLVLYQSIGDLFVFLNQLTEPKCKNPIVSYYQKILCGQVIELCFQLLRCLVFNLSWLHTINFNEFQ
jgi:hypothetical protein